MLFFDFSLLLFLLSGAFMILSSGRYQVQKAITAITATAVPKINVMKSNNNFSIINTACVLLFLRAFQQSVVLAFNNDVFISNSLCGSNRQSARTYHRRGCFRHVASQPKTNFAVKEGDDDDQQMLLVVDEVCKNLSIKSNQINVGEKDGVRGMFLHVTSNRICEGDILLSVPLSSCLRDDSPPSWLFGAAAACDGDGDGDDVANNSCSYDATAWATRLAASLLDVMLRQSDDSHGNERHVKARGPLLKRGLQQWQSQVLPKSFLLRASLPVHWPAKILNCAKCQSLELAVDSAFFGRENAAMDLMDGLMQSDLSISSYDRDSLKRLCHDALDIVQTRTCRVDTGDDEGVPLRILAPVFDLLNHNANPNASFNLESGSLIVRATRDIEPGSEVLISYGDVSTTPSWRALFSYGFIPSFNEGDERNTVELLVDGAKAEVGGDNLPLELVESAASNLWKQSGRGWPPKSEDENIFTSAVAHRIADIAMKESQNLIEINCDVKTNSEEEAFSLSLANSLRLSHYQVLSLWATSLKEYANQNPDAS